MPAISGDNVTVTLGESSVAGNAFSASVVDVQSFTTGQGSENVSINMLSASAVSITLGEQTMHLMYNLP